MRPVRKPSSPTVNEIAEETRPGRCVFCDEPLKPYGPKAAFQYPISCASDECATAHRACLKADLRAAVDAVGESVDVLEAFAP